MSASVLTADLETYDLFHDQHEQPERMRGVSRGNVAYKDHQCAYWCARIAR